MSHENGVEIDNSIVSGILTSTQAGETQLQEFINLRLKATSDYRKNFFDKIPNLKIKTGQEKTKKDQQVLNILKEEKQAFGVLVRKNYFPRRGTFTPFDNRPTCPSHPRKRPKTRYKIIFRNYLIEESTSVIEETPKGCNWLIDEMAAVNSIPSQQTWGGYADSLLQSCMPASQFEPLQVAIIFDRYNI